MNKGAIYTAIRNQIISSDTNGRIKFVGKQNKQHELLKDGKTLGFALPAVLIGFRSPSQAGTVGGGVQVVDIIVEIEVLHEFYNESETGTALNLDVYDVEKDVHGYLQFFEVRGTDYGCSAFDRIEEEEDDSHDQIFSKKSGYSTTFTDNSTTTPRGGYLIDPPLDAGITENTLIPDLASVITSVSSLDFGNIAIGASSTRTFTIQGVNLGIDPIILSTSNPLFTITLNANYKTRLAIAPTDGAAAETTVTVKYSPITGGGSAGSILYGVPGSEGEITLSGAAISDLLEETGDKLLTEAGDDLLL